MHYTYVLQSKKDGDRYIGCTHDLKKRFVEHNSGKVTSTKNRRPFTLIYYEACLNKDDAFQRERYLKRRWGSKYLATRLKKYYENV